jgi:hypothetical protein
MLNKRRWRDGGMTQEFGHRSSKDKVLSSNSSTKKEKENGLGVGVLAQVAECPLSKFEAPEFKPQYC